MIDKEKQQEGAMPKVSLQSKDLLAEKKEQLKQLFPEVFAEGKINFSELKKTLGESVNSSQERFGLQWAGKSECYQRIQERSSATLKPCLQKEDIKQFLHNDSENVFIEGDNLEVLKLLQESYFAKIKMIYIDPPYNTGKEFIYPDKYKDNLQTYLEYTGQVDNNGKKFSTNSEQTGRYHSNWLSMMYPRLFLARNLLREDGVIFISIDDHEQANLKKICDQIFGEDNFICVFNWNTKRGAQGMATKNLVVPNHEYILCYAKNSYNFKFQGQERIQDKGFSNPDNDPRGRWKRQYLQRLAQGLPKRTIIDPNTQNKYTFETPYAQEKLNQWVEENRIIFPKNLNQYPARKEFLAEYKNKKQLITHLGLYATKSTTEEVYAVFDKKKIFTNPKPHTLLQFLLRAMHPDITVLDFFAGSGTTADAAMKLNAEDGGKRKFIMVQLQEPCKEDSEAFKAGYKNIAEIGKERIRRSAMKIKQDLQDKILNLQQKIEKAEKKATASNQEKQQEITAEIEKQQQEIASLKNRIKKLDLSFQSFYLTTSNFKEWETDPSKQKDLKLALETQVHPIKENSNDLDIIFEILLKEGILLSTKITSKTIANKKVYFIEKHQLYICLEKINLALIDKILEKNPNKIILLDSNFDGNDELKINCFQRIKICWQQKNHQAILKTI